MYIDLTPLLNKEAKWAVHCPTAELARLFVKAMREQYPDFTEAWQVEDRWEDYKDKTTYLPDINGLSGYNRLTYASLDYFQIPSNGYVVISVESLIKTFDLPEFQVEDGSSLYSMLGIDTKA